MRKMRLVHFSVLFFPLCLHSAAGAAVVLRASLEELAQTADVVVRGRVGQQQSRWDEGGHRIFTYAELQVEEVLKGDLPPFALIRQPGGVVGDIGQKVSGAARFTSGEEVILLLQQAPDDPSVYLPLGMAAGKLGIDAQALGGPRVYRSLDGLALYEPGADASPEKPGLTLRAREDLGALEALLARLRRAVEASR